MFLLLLLSGTIHLDETKIHREALEVFLHHLLWKEKVLLGSLNNHTKISYFVNF